MSVNSSNPTYEETREDPAPPANALSPTTTHVVRNRLRTGICPLAPDWAGTRPPYARENGDRGG
jgi:hypothetical protein